MSGLIAVAIASAFAATVAGLLLSYYANVPTGPAIVLLCGPSTLSRCCSARAAASSGASFRAGIWKPDLNRGVVDMKASRNLMARIGRRDFLSLCRVRRMQQTRSRRSPLSASRRHVRQVGGDRVEVVTLVGRTATRMSQPTPADAKALASADVSSSTGSASKAGSIGWRNPPTSRARSWSRARACSPHHDRGGGRRARDGHRPPCLAGPRHGKIYVANIRDG